MLIQAVDSAVLVFGGACVLGGIALVLLIAAPWKSVRAEPPLDADIEARLLLGEDPAAIAADTDTDVQTEDS